MTPEDVMAVNTSDKPGDDPNWRQTRAELLGLAQYMYRHKSQQEGFYQYSIYLKLAVAMADEEPQLNEILTPVQLDEYWPNVHESLLEMSEALNKQNGGITAAQIRWCVAKADLWYRLKRPIFGKFDLLSGKTVLAELGVRDEQEESRDESVQPGAEDQTGR